MDDILLTKYLLKETNEEETAAVRQWIAARPENNRHYQHLLKLWETSYTLVEESHVDEDQAWQRFVKRRDEQQAALTGPHKGVLKRTGWMGVAASLMLVSVAALIGYFSVVSNRSQLHSAVYETSDEVRTDTLMDGSIITLNNHATMRFSQGGTRPERQVELQKGEVFFRVASDRNKPFVIRSGQVTVTVLGTSFHVRRKADEETEVIVESGQVRVEGLNKVVELTPGQKVSINTRTQQFDEGEVEDQLHNYYVSNHFVLDETPLWRIAEVLETVYGVEIEIERDEIRDLPLTTTFPKGELAGILHIICEALGVIAEQHGNRILFK